MKEPLAPPVGSPSNALNRSSGLHIDRLDTIRILAAAWVAVSHGALQIKPLTDSGLLRILFAGIQGSFNGVAAVMVFFIVSGFCIHLPNSNSNKNPGAIFLARRYLRIGAPLVAISIIAKMTGHTAESFLYGVTWSIYVEIAYYTAYPIIFRLAKRWGWTSLLIVSAAISLVITASMPNQLFVREMGWLAAPWGLPIWISGCLAAEWFHRGQLPRVLGNVNFWRVSTWLLSVLGIVMLFHSPVRIGSPIFMLVFSPVAFFWFIRELTSPGKAWPPLERLGVASYSLYLVHPVVLGAFADWGIVLSPSIDVILRPLAVIAGTAAFYYAVEAPSHRLARMLKQSANQARLKIAK